jgi:hypothetical protein
VWATLLSVASGATALAELRESGQAMACCAKADYSCAGMRAPDDCCRHMGHGVARAVPATIDSHQPLQAATEIPADFGPQVFASLASVASVATFTRPHDPPHLHPFALLI